MINRPLKLHSQSAEIEQLDYRGGTSRNIFFGPEKMYFGRSWSLFTVNFVVLNGMSLAVLVSVFLLLKRQLMVRTRRPPRWR